MLQQRTEKLVLAAAERGLFVHMGSTVELDVLHLERLLGSRFREEAHHSLDVIGIHMGEHHQLE